jgi:kynurenine formamidase
VAKVPDFDQLPRLEPLGFRHAWGVFGSDDELGTLNHLTPERVLDAIGLVRAGEVFNLSLRLSAIDPPLYDREAMLHSVFPPDRNTRDDRLDNFFLQASTHWDGFRHVRARELGFWGGVTDDELIQPGSGPLGIEKWVEHGIVGRGVLLDLGRHLAKTVPGYNPFERRSITPAELIATAQTQATSLEPGDILCIRTGWLARYRELDGAGRKAVARDLAFAGLAADEEMSRWLWNQRLAAVACDNPGVEVMPGDPKVGFLHRRVIPLLGMVLGELFDFERLAVESAGDGRFDFLFASVPLNLAGGVGSPANAVGIR